MKKMLLLLLFAGNTICLQAQQSFDDLLNLFEKPNQLIPEALAKTYFGFEPKTKEDVLDQLSIIERKNVELLLSFEQQK